MSEKPPKGKRVGLHHSGLGNSKLQAKDLTTAGQAKRHLSAKVGLGVSQLAEQHRDKLLPASVSLRVFVRVMVLHNPVKFYPIYQR